MNPKAAIFTFLLLALRFSLAFSVTLFCAAPCVANMEFEEPVPWRGVNNSIFSSARHLEPFNRSAEVLYCGGVGTVDVEFPPFREPSQSHKNTALAPDALWQERLATASAFAKEKAIIHRIDGSARVSINSRQSKAKPGQKVSAETDLVTETASVLDLFLVKNDCILRIMPGSEIQITRLAVENTGPEKAIDAILDLRRGSILGLIKNVATPSSYLIRTHGGLIQVLHADHDRVEYKIDADGSCAIISGSAEIITPTHIHTVNTGEKYDPTQTASQNK